MTQDRRGARPVYLTPFGLYSRYMLGAYLRHTMMVAAALMTIALTIDLWPQVPLMTADPSLGPVQAVWGIVRLAALRIPDLLPPFLPFATFLGVVWSESAFTESRERLLIWNSARSPLFDVDVPIVAHELAQPDKGSGIAMICTFGDTTDVTSMPTA